MSRPSAIPLPLAEAEVGGDVEQLVDAVRARVTGADGAKAVVAQRLCELRVVEHVVEVPLPLTGVPRDKEVRSRLEEPLDVVPRRRHERDTARERLEGPDGGDARE